MMKLDPKELDRDLSKLCERIGTAGSARGLKLALSSLYGKLGGGPGARAASYDSILGPSLSHYMETAGRRMGEAYARAASVTALRGVPLAAYRYARHFSALRQATREAAAAGAALVTVENLLLRASESSQVECTTMQAQIMLDPSTRRPVPSEKVSRLKRVARMQSECLEALETQQNLLGEVGQSFVDVVAASRAELGESFTMRLVNHCDEKVRENPLLANGWKLFCTWWRARDPLYARAVLDLRLLSSES